MASSRVQAPNSSGQRRPSITLTRCRASRSACPRSAPWPGLSTHFTGRKRAYELTDMIGDMMAVLDAMGWESAHLAGLSMGGGLAQFAALLHPERVRTLTLISAVPQYGSAARLFRYIRFPGPFRMALRRYGDSPAEKERMIADITRLTASRSMPLDDEWVTQVAAEAVRRRYPDPHARARQLAAGFAARLPDGGIARISHPVLVISGGEDPIVRPSAGRAIATTVRDGRLRAPTTSNMLAP
jgi:pimeloyl-ACP methyl ester carboxylesterase